MTDERGADGLAIWNEQDLMRSIAALYGGTVEKGQQAIGWYQKNLRWKRRGSQFCRTAAIILVGIGSLLPLLAAALASLGGSQTKIPFEFGYVVFALAGGCLAFDKFYGLSSGWIRYIKAQLALEGALDEMRYDWVALIAKVQGQNPTSDQVQALIERLRAFIVYVHAQVAQETESWVLEFQGSLADLEKAARVRAEAQKPGRIEVAVTNAAAFDQVSASLDGMEVRAVEGGRSVFAVVPPGAHLVMVRAKKESKTVQASESVRLQPDTVASLSVTLPAG